MPPKPKTAPAKAKKAAPKPKDKKPVVDKTFGLKNKKGKKAATIIRSAKGSEMNSKAYQEELERKKEADRARARDKLRKEKIEQDKKEAEERVLMEAESKANTLCEEFAQGSCRLGNTCEYLHDWNKVQRKETLDPYVDPRTGTDNDPGDKAAMCYAFLEAVREKKYGYFWVCPNKGNRCHYRHCLPPGYIVPGDDAVDIVGDDFDEEALVENKIDFERDKLLGEKSDLPKMTLETFIEWQNAFLENKPKVLLTEAVKIAENDKKKIKPTGRQLWQSGGLKSVDFVEKDGKNADFGEKAPEEKQNAAVKVGDEALFLDESLLEDLERFELE